MSKFTPYLGGLHHVILAFLAIWLDPEIGGEGGTRSELTVWLWVHKGYGLAEWYFLSSHSTGIAMHQPFFQPCIMDLAKFFRCLVSQYHCRHCRDLFIDIMCMCSNIYLYINGFILIYRNRYINTSDPLFNGFLLINHITRLAYFKNYLVQPFQIL